MVKKERIKASLYKFYREILKDIWGSADKEKRETYVMEKLSSILLIDDDPLTSYLHKRAIEGFNVADRIEIATNGEKAIHFINDCIQSQRKNKFLN